MTQLFEAVNDTMTADRKRFDNGRTSTFTATPKTTGRGANLDNLVPLLGNRFKRKPGGRRGSGDDGGENP